MKILMLKLKIKFNLYYYLIVIAKNVLSNIILFNNLNFL